MNIVLATDDCFVQHCCVAMTSVLKHNNNVTFYVFTEVLKAENVDLMSSLVTRMGGQLKICLIDSEIVRIFPMPSNADAHISVATYYRLLAEIVLPVTLDKFIYMDCDMVVRNSMAALWNENMDGYALGAVYQPISDSQEKDKERLGIPKRFGYFNAGLLLVNLSYWRNHHVTERLLSFIRDYYSRIKQHDQDVLNAVLYRETKPIHYKWNYLPAFMEMDKIKFHENVNYSGIVGEPVVIHFVSAPKPWDFGCKHPYKSEYYKYLMNTPFNHFKPRFVWKKYFDNILRHKIIKFCISLDIFNLRKRMKN